MILTDRTVLSKQNNTLVPVSNLFILSIKIQNIFSFSLKPYFYVSMQHITSLHSRNLHMLQCFTLETLMNN